AGSTVDFVGDKKTVEITLPKGTVAKDTSYKLSVSTDVTTAQGAHIVGSTHTKEEASGTVGLKDNTVPELNSAVYALENEGDSKTDQIVLTFNETVQNPDNDDFTVEINGAKQELTGTAAVTGDGNKVILTLDGEVNVSQTATVTIDAENQDAVKTTDTSSNTNKAKLGSSIQVKTTKVGKESPADEETEG